MSLHVLFLRETPALLQIRAGAETGIDGAGQHQGPRWSQVGADAETSYARLLAIGTILRMDVVDFDAESGQEGLGDGVSGLGAVELEDANVARGSGGDVGDADERFGFGGVEAADGCRGRARGRERYARRHFDGQCWAVESYKEREIGDREFGVEDAAQLVEVTSSAFIGTWSCFADQKPRAPARLGKCSLMYERLAGDRTRPDNGLATVIEYLQQFACALCQAIGV